jgi:hypothetical protein
MRGDGFVSRPTRVAENPYRSCFQSFTPVERKADEGLVRDMRKAWPEPTPFYRMNCARDALKTASNGHCCLEKAGRFYGKKSQLVRRRT